MPEAETREATTTTSTADDDFVDSAIIGFSGRSGSLTNPPELGETRRYIVAGRCIKRSDELQDNGDTRLVCTIKAQQVYEVGVSNPDAGGLFPEPCPHCGHTAEPGDVMDGEVVNSHAALIRDDQAALPAGDVVDAEVVEDDEVDE